MTPLLLALVLMQAPQSEFDRFAARVRAYPQLHRAYRLIEKGQLPEARQTLELALRIRPGDNDALRTYVLLLHRLNDYPASIRAATTLLERQPQDGLTLLYRALSQQSLGKTDLAIQDFQRAADSGLPPKDRAFALHSRAELEIAAGRPDRALQAAAAVALPERDRTARARLAGLYEKANQDDQARTAWQTVLALDAQDLVALRALADLEYRQARYRESLGWISKLNAKAATTATLDFELQLLIRLEDYVAADALAERRLAAPDEASQRQALLLVQADIAQRQRDPERERAKLLKAATGPVPAATAARLGTLFAQLEKLPEALTWYRRALAQRRDFDTVLATARIESLLNRPAEALPLYREALPLLRTSAERYEIWVALGNSQLALRQPAAAVASFTQAAQLQPAPAARPELATALELSGDPRRAVEVLNEAVAVRADPEWLLRLSTLNAGLGELLLSRDQAAAALPGLSRPADQALAYRQLGFSQAQVGDLRAARAALESALMIEGNSVELLRELLSLSLQAQDAAGAVRYSQPLAAVADAPTQVMVAKAAALAGNLAAAIERLAKLPPQWEVAALIAGYEARRDRPSAAADQLRLAAAMPGAPRVQLLEQAAGHLVFSKRLPEARAVYRELVQLAGSDALRVANLYARLGDIESLMNRDEEAAAAYQAALDHGLDTTLRLANTLARLRHFADAAPLYEQLLRRSPTPSLARSLAECYLQMEEPNRALEALTQALPPEPELPPNERAGHYRQAAYLATVQGQLSRALGYWEQAQRIAPTSLGRLRLLTTALRLGQPVTLDQLAEVDGAALSPAERNELFDLQGTLLEQAGRRAEAIAVLEQANQIARTPERSFFLAGLYQQLGRLDDAIDQYQWVSQQPSPPPGWSSPLAYALAAKGDIMTAAEVLERELQRHPAQPRLEAQLGYLYRRRGQNPQAIESFERTLAGLGTAPGFQQERRQIRRDLSELRRRLSWGLYWGFASAGLQDQSFLGTGFGPAVPSQGGAEINWRPPGIGFRNDRIFTVFARLLWANRFQSLAVNSQSAQLGFGIRYKPLRTQNLHFSGERLVRVGNAALNSWLFRTTFSASHGELPWIATRPTLYSTAFADVAHFTSAPATWLYLGQARVGYSVPLSARLLLSPHTVVEARYQDRARQRLSYLQTGAGVALNFSLTSDPEAPPQGRIELLAQYRWGRFLDRHPSLVAAADQVFSGLYLSVAMIR